MSVGAGTVPTTDVVLNDTWPDCPKTQHWPSAGFTGSPSNNIATPPSGLKVGDKVTLYDNTSGAPFTMIYLKKGDASTTVAFAAGIVVRPAGSTDNSAEEWYTVNNRPDDQMFADGIGPAAITVSAVTNDYHFWAWCGGHVPQDTIRFTSLLAAASIKTYLDAGHSAASAFCAGDDQTSDCFALIEPASYLQSIFGWIKAAAGGSAS